jgi:predicted lipid-binding transport protein (Tim44 family)
MNSWFFFLMLSLSLVAPEASANRLANDGTAGQVSSSVTSPTGESGSGTAPGATPAVAGGVVDTSSAASAPSRGWLGGLAAGLGLVWLATSLGLESGLSQWLLAGLAVVVLAAVVGGCVVWLRNSSATRSGRAGLAFQTAGEAAPARAYSPANVGNDASARPWERSTTGFDVGRVSEAPQASSVHAASGLVAVTQGFDVDAFLKASKDNFIALQAAWDRADVAMLRAMMTDDMLAQIKAQLAAHERDTGVSTTVTDVVMLDASLLGVEQRTDGLVASVEFSGLVREDASAGPSPFREIWSITRPASGHSGWLVAGVQALQ